MNSAVDLTYLYIFNRWWRRSGGGTSPSYAAGGGGGAGGMLNGSGPTISVLGPNPYTVTIGGGGQGGPYSSYNPEPTGKGTNSTLSGPTGTVLVAQGGGVGGTGYPSTSTYGPGKPGGCGGGGGLGSPTYPTQPSYPTNGNLAWLAVMGFLDKEIVVVDQVLLILRLMVTGITVEAAAVLVVMVEMELTHHGWTRILAIISKQSKLEY